MAEKTKFYCIKSMVEGLDCVTLGYRDADHPESDIEAGVTPTMGSNLYKLYYGGHKIIDSDLKMIAGRGFPGTPVLYPTPNRVRNARITFQGKTYAQVKRQKNVTLHGLVLNEPWNFEGPEADSDSATLTTWISFDENSAMFEAFPFRSRLAIRYTLSRSGLRMDYTVDNLGDSPLPFGFGLHPFFQRLSGDNDTLVSIPARYVMDSTADLLPTGRLVDVEGTIFDLRKETPVGDTDMDHVFTGLTHGKPATIWYRTLGIRISLEATEDFTHVVFFSPKGSPIFCLENQTCSTDAHNLHDRGFVKESCLRIVKPGESAGGTVEFRIER